MEDNKTNNVVTFPKWNKQIDQSFYFPELLEHMALYLTVKSGLMGLLANEFKNGRITAEELQLFNDLSSGQEDSSIKDILDNPLNYSK